MCICICVYVYKCYCHPCQNQFLKSGSFDSSIIESSLLKISYMIVPLGNWGLNLGVVPNTVKFQGKSESNVYVF